MSKDITIPGDEAYLSFGGWSKAMPNPPAMHERRRYIVDVECTSATVAGSSKGERGSRKLSILRVHEIAGVNVPPRRDDEDEGDDTPPMFDEAGDPIDDASADEGDEIRAKRAEDAEDAAREAAEAEAANDADGEGAGDGEGADETSNDGVVDAEVVEDDDDGRPWPGDADATVTPMFKAANDE